MTPEERFERIEKMLDRGAANHEKRFAKIDRICEFLANQQAQAASDMAEIRKHAKEVDARLDRLGKQLDARFDRLGSFLASIGIVANTALKAIEDHAKNGHGGKPKRARRKK